MTERKYGRRYLRIKPDRALNAEMYIIQIESQNVKTRSSKVRILDISPGGLRFTSALDFPVQPRIVLEFKIQKEEQNTCLGGSIVHKSEAEEGLYEYGVCFSTTDESFRGFLLKLFNLSSISKNKYILVLRMN